MKRKKGKGNDANKTQKKLFNMKNSDLFVVIFIVLLALAIFAVSFYVREDMSGAARFLTEEREVVDISGSSSPWFAVEVEDPKGVRIERQKFTEKGGSYDVDVSMRVDVGGKSVKTKIAFENLINPGREKLIFKKGSLEEGDRKFGNMIIVTEVLAFDDAKFNIVKRGKDVSAITGNAIVSGLPGEPDEPVRQVAEPVQIDGSFVEENEGEQISFSKAMLSLAVDEGFTVQKIYGCYGEDFDYDRFTCVQWQPTEIAFVQNKDAGIVTFEVLHFSAYAGGGTLEKGENVYITVEAEDAEIMNAPFEIGDDVTAFGDNESPYFFGTGYVFPNDAGFLGAPYTAEVAIPFTIEYADDYYLWIRMLGEDSAHDKFFITFDGDFGANPEGRKVFTTNDPAMWGNYEWILCGNTINGGDGNTVFSLTAGNHNITFDYGDGMTRADQFIITNDSTFIPDSKPMMHCGVELNESVNLEYDLVCPGTAIVINENNVVLDCQGHSIIYGSDGLGGYGISNTVYDNVIIKNCNIDGTAVSSYAAIYLSGGAENVTIMNNNLTTSNGAIRLNEWANSTNITGNIITAGVGHGILAYSSHNTISNNNITAGVGSYYGIYLIKEAKYNWVDGNKINTANAGIFLNFVGADITHSHNILNNNITTNGVVIWVNKAFNNNFTGNTLSTTGSESAIYIMDSAVDNIFRNNNIVNTPEAGVMLVVSGGYPENNTFINNTFGNIGWNQDIRINTAGINGTLLKDQKIRGYYFAGAGSIVHFENSSAGKLEYLEPISGIGLDLSAEIQIHHNLIEVDSVTAPHLNKAANLTLYDVTGISTPVALRNGLDCGAFCGPITSDGDNYSFSVTEFTNYSVGDAGGNTVTCGDVIDTPGQYVVEATVTNYNAGDCIVINVSDVELDCQGFTLAGDTEVAGLYGIYAYGDLSNKLNNVTLKNCVVSDFDTGIYIDYVDHSTFNNLSVTQQTISGLSFNVGSYNNITNCIFDDTNIGIYLANTVTQNRFVNNTIIKNLGSGVHLITGNVDNNLFYNNYLNNTNNFFGFINAENDWNTTKQAGINIIGRNYIGGNYWADPSGNGHSETCTDTDGDGICEEIYYFDITNVDELPLTYNTVDTEPPIVGWLPPTPEDNNVTENTYAYLNASITDMSRTAAFLDFGGDLVGYWSMENYNSTGIYDDSTYDNFATFEGGLSTDNITEGMYGDALEFDGIHNAVLGDYLLVPDDDSLDMGTNDMTFSIWMKLESSSRNYAVFFGKGADSDYAGYVFYYRPNAGSIGVQTDIDGEHRNGSSSDSNLNLDDDTWHHIVAVVDRDTEVVFYVDGQPEGTSTGLLPHAGIDILGDLDLTVGKWGEHINDHYLNGSLDEAMIFKRALSTEEVLALYDSQINNPKNNFTGLAPSVTHTYSAYAIDTSGNSVITGDRYFTVGPCIDGDGDGYNITGGGCGPVDCNDTNSSIYPGAPEACNGIDDDCDEVLDGSEGLGQQCGLTDVGECTFGTEQCNDTGGWENCDAIFPQAEFCDGIDTDCDTNPDNGLTAPLCVQQNGVCEDSVQICGGIAGWLPCDAASYGPNYEEGTELTCTDTLDNDCDIDLDCDDHPDCDDDPICVIPPSFQDISIDQAIYMEGDTIDFTAEWLDEGRDCRVVISTTLVFTDCNYTHTTGCIADSGIVAGIAGLNTVNFPYTVQPGDDGVTWYAQVCNDVGQCDEMLETITSLHPEVGLNEVWKDRDVYDTANCLNNDPDPSFIVQPADSCELWPTKPSMDCVEFLTYEHLLTDDLSGSYGADSYSNAHVKSFNCLHGALRYIFDLSSYPSPDALDFEWQGYFINDQTSNPLEGKLYVYDYSSSQFSELPGSSIDSSTEVIYTTTLDTNLNNYISGNKITFLAWDYQGIENPTTNTYWDNIFNDYVVLDVVQESQASGQFAPVECVVDGDCAADEIQCSGVWNGTRDWQCIDNQCVDVFIPDTNCSTLTNYHCDLDDLIYEEYNCVDLPSPHCGIITTTTEYCNDLDITYCAGLIWWQDNGYCNADGDETCTVTSNNMDCDDYDVCTGIETCDDALGCQGAPDLDCDDFVPCTDDTCDAVLGCDNTENDTNCDNGFYCDGNETCHITEDCQEGTPPDCTDTVGCTDDSCNEGTDSCDHIPMNSWCDDGVSCTANTCDAVNDCEFPEIPGFCDDEFSCTDDSCDLINDCINDPNNNHCVDPEVCDPFVFPPPSGCGEYTGCEGQLAGTPCFDGLYCNGDDFCDGADNCVNAGPIACNDTFDCTEDSCVEGATGPICTNAPNDALCPDDGVFCNGEEYCDVASDCAHRNEPDCDDLVDCTVDGCNIGTDSCDNIPDNGYCSNSNVCDGDEFCLGGTPGTGCQAGTPLDCTDPVDCTDDTCDPILGCANTANDANCDDGFFCNGTETCDEVDDCQPGTDPCLINNWDPIETCFNSPDDIGGTWDYFAGFTSLCNEFDDTCSEGSVDLTHTCNISECGADCEDGQTNATGNLYCNATDQNLYEQVDVCNASCEFQYVDYTYDEMEQDCFMNCSDDVCNFTTGKWWDYDDEDTHLCVDQSCDVTQYCFEPVETCDIVCGAECDAGTVFVTNNFYCDGENINRTLEGCSDETCAWDAALATDEYTGVTCTGTGEDNMCYNGSDSCNHCDDGLDNDGDGLYDYDDPDCSNRIECDFDSGLGIIICQAKLSGQHIQHNTVYVDGFDVQIEIPVLLISSNESVGVYDITVTDFDWVVSSDIYADQSGVLAYVTLDDTNISWTANFSADVLLLFNVSAPAKTAIIVDQNATKYAENFTVTCNNHLYDVYSNNTVNDSFREYSLYWLDEDGAWVYANGLYDVRLVNGNLSFNGFSMSEQEFYIYGSNESCTQAWDCTPWSEGDCGTRICTCHCTYGGCSGDSTENKECESGDGDGDGDSDGDGGFGPPRTPENVTNETCNESWVCSAWSPCSENIQNRTCDDANGCNTTEYLPILFQPCLIENVTNQTYTDDNWGEDLDTETIIEEERPGKSLFSWWWLLIPAVLAAAGEVFAYRSFNSRKKILPFIEKLDRYIEVCLVKKMTDEEIVMRLMGSGWDKPVIKRRLKKIKNAK